MWQGETGLGDAWVAPQPWYPLVAFALSCCVAASGMPDLKNEIVMDGSLTLAVNMAKIKHQEGQPCLLHLWQGEGAKCLDSCSQLPNLPMPHRYKRQSWVYI